MVHGACQGRAPRSACEYVRRTTALETTRPAHDQLAVRSAAGARIPGAVAGVAGVQRRHVDAERRRRVADDLAHHLARTGGTDADSDESAGVSYRPTCRYA